MQTLFLSFCGNEIAKVIPSVLLFQLLPRQLFLIGHFEFSGNTFASLMSMLM